MLQLMARRIGVLIRKLLPNRRNLWRIAIILTPLLVVWFAIRVPASHVNFEVVRIINREVAYKDAGTYGGPIGEFRLTNTSGSPVYLMGASKDEVYCMIWGTDAFTPPSGRLTGLHYVDTGPESVKIEPGASLLLCDLFCHLSKTDLYCAAVSYSSEPFGGSKIVHEYNGLLNKLGLGNWAIQNATEVHPVATDPFELQVLLPWVEQD